jgi:hypothetical protein
MSNFISSMRSAGLMEMPPESKVTPLPTRLLPFRSGHVFDRNETRFLMRALCDAEQRVHALTRNLLPVEHGDLHAEPFTEFARTVGQERRRRHVAGAGLQPAGKIRAACRDGAYPGGQLQFAVLRITVSNQCHGLDPAARRVLLCAGLELAVVPCGEYGSLDGSEAGVVVAHVLAEVVHMTDGDGEIADGHPLGHPDSRADSTAQTLDRIVLALACAHEEDPPDADIRVGRIDHQRVVGATREVGTLQDAADSAAEQAIDLGDKTGRLPVPLEDVQHEKLRAEFLGGGDSCGDPGFRHVPRSMFYV